MILVPEYGIGVGDRSGLEGIAQLGALVRLKTEHGKVVIPTWNKSRREHEEMGTNPRDVWVEAYTTTDALKWTHGSFVDADHVNIGNVNGTETVGTFIPYSNFFTIDVADYIDNPEERASAESIDEFVRRYRDLGTVDVNGVELAFNEQNVREFAVKYLRAIQEAGNTYEFIKALRGRDDFVTEVSMDETKDSQSPFELYLILSELGRMEVPVQTIAPKFTGNFYKAVDYVGPIPIFMKEFEEDNLVIKYAIEHFGLPATLKLSVHSGSDKFSLYPGMHDIITRLDMGIHLKTAGTTWMEELHGITADREGCAFVHHLYETGLAKIDLLKDLYWAVCDIDEDKLLTPAEFSGFNGTDLAGVFVHDTTNPLFSPDVRGLLHISYPVLKRCCLMEQFKGAVGRNSEYTAKCVGDNIYRHAKPLFVGE